MNILIITYDYPDRKRDVFPFVKNLVDEWIKNGHHCMVIAPYSITKNKSWCNYRNEDDSWGHKLNIYRPRYISLSTLQLFGYSVTSLLKKNAVARALKRLKYRPDVIYCHFWDMALEACDYSMRNKLPLFVATGESCINQYNKKETSLLRKVVRGVIAVSSHNCDISISNGLVSPEDVIILPNAIDNKLFCVKDKHSCRIKLGLPVDAYIIIFVGWFINRKGSKRVDEALKSSECSDVYSIFIGSGEEAPNNSNILFKGRLAHHEIPEYLNAADVFVLPTLNEGCCNAIVEAMACGLPIISSELPFNKDVCDASNSILIDPHNINEIREAILMLRDDKGLRTKLSEGALKKAETLTIDKRASSIIDFMKEKVNNKYL